MQFPSIVMVGKIFRCMLFCIPLFICLHPGLIDSPLSVSSLSPSVAFQDAQISTIHISFSEEYWGCFDRDYSIELRNDSYYYGDQQIHPSLIDQFQNSFTDLYETENFVWGSGGIIVLDYEPRFKVQITFTQGQLMTVASTSVYHCFIPWNIIYGGKMYVQYNGKIPSALMRLLISIDGQGWPRNIVELAGKWSCYPALVPDMFADQEFSNDFPQSSEYTPLVEKGKDHLLWTYNLQEFNMCMPAYAQNQIFIVAKNKVCAFDVLKGEKIWEIPFTTGRSQFKYGGTYIAVHEDLVYVTAPDSYVYALDITTGEMRWMYDTGSISPPRLFLYEGNVLMDSDGILYVDGKTGEKIWQLSEKKYLKAVYGDVILIAYYKDGFNDEIVDIQSGEILWRMECTDYYRSMHESNTIYVHYQDPDYLVCMDHLSHVLWSYRCSSDRKLRYQVLEDTVCIVTDSIYQDTNPYETVMLFNKDGSLLWKIDAPVTPVYYPCEVARIKENENTVFLVLEGGTIHALDKMTGTFLWENEIKGVSLCNFQSRDPMIYLTSCDGKIHCLDGETGNLVWKFNTVSEFNIWDSTDLYVFCTGFCDGIMIVVTRNGIIIAMSQYPVWFLPSTLSSTSTGYIAV